MKKFLLLVTVLLISVVSYAQNQEEKSLGERLNLLEKRADKFNVYFNYQSSFDAVQPKDGDLETSFKARQLRLEMRGNITDKLFYRLRHRLNKNNAGASLDNLAKATDMMYVGYNFNDKFTIIGGKQCQAWGGFEFDLNPMNIYEYSDFIENMDNFMVGVDFIFTPMSGQEVHFQVTNSRNDTFEKIYGEIPGIEASKNPLTYILNWNGNFLDNQFQTRWAYGIETEAKDKYSYMLTIGNKLNLSQFQLAVDYMRANQDLDRLGYASGSVRGLILSEGEVFKDVTYNTFIAKAEFQPNAQWNIFLKGMYETASVKDIPVLKDNFRKSYGCYTGVEYFPFTDKDLRIFLAYVGRKFELNDNSDISTYTNRVSVGMMYRIKAF